MTTTERTSPQHHSQHHPQCHSQPHSQGSPQVHPRCRPRYTRDYLIDILREKHQELGRTPTEVDMNVDPDTPSIAAYFRIFGSWNQAIIAAGLDPNQVGTHFASPIRLSVYHDAQKVVIQLAGHLWKPPTQDSLNAELARREIPQITTILRWSESPTDSYSKFLESIRPELERVIRASVLAEIAQRTQELGRAPTPAELLTDPRLRRNALRGQHFLPLDLLGLAHMEPLAVPAPLDGSLTAKREWLIALLQAKAAVLGRTPKIFDLASDHTMPSPGVFVRYFQTWNNALRAAGFSPNAVTSGRPRSRTSPRRRSERRPRP